MKEYLKVLVLIAILLYIFSPADIAPGPIDDIIVILLGLILDDHFPIPKDNNQFDQEVTNKC